MKFGLFYEVQMPKPLGSDDWPPGYEAAKFKEALDQIELADKVGFDYLWVAEHHFTDEYTHTSAPDLLLAAASQRTKTIRLGTGVVQMPPGHNHPARVAERMATLDVLSDGRLEFGTGRGGPNELGFFIQDVTDTKAMWREATRECLKMMSLTPYPGYDGDYVHMPTANVVPKPLQKPHPPVWVASVHQETMVEAGRTGMGSLILSHEGPESIREWVATYWRSFHEGVEPIGQAINLAVSTSIHAMCAKTDEEAQRRERGGFEYFNYAIHRSLQTTRTPGRHIYREFVEQQKQQRQQASVAVANGAIAEHGDQPVLRQLLVGSPDTLRKQFREYEATHVDMVTMMVQSGDRRHEDIMEAIDLIGTQVIPEFDERHPKHQEWRCQQIGELPYPVNSSI